MSDGRGIWSGVRERVLALREAPYWHEVFGAVHGSHGHRFELRPVLTEDEVARAERRIGATLPHEYRTFLLDVGGGGAGPDYGLYPLTPDDPLARRAALPFRAGHTDELAAHEALEPRPADYGDSAEEQTRLHREYAAWDRRWEELSDTLTDGTLCVGEQGCGYYTLLAVTGDERGTMWDDVRAVGEGVLPAARTREDRTTYAQWYLNWLRYAERRATTPPTERP
ncbi:SMI1/KNR4 family protein [Streptomyces boluensis]|uniref:Knr4/Smi1-like domain-containing protein n=1 Tax=Streptomyces boluensis TaxID=1775135 RepID=A0A964UP44_9ACTN|nr:SMI1/KNR4 family protein [Streptomyces boluensis]NBE50462.1 hypothetical protein [Streptomyces boluensis]